jgi:hypothetical protein
MHGARRRCTAARVSIGHVVCAHACFVSIDCSRRVNNQHWHQHLPPSTPARTTHKLQCAPHLPYAATSVRPVALHASAVTTSRRRPVAPPLSPLLRAAGGSGSNARSECTSWGPCRTAASIRNRRSSLSRALAAVFPSGCRSSDSSRTTRRGGRAPATPSTTAPACMLHRVQRTWVAPSRCPCLLPLGRQLLQPAGAGGTRARASSIRGAARARKAARPASEPAAAGAAAQAPSGAHWEAASA